MAPDAEHVHPDDLALLALDEHVDGVDEAHLSRCAQCRAEVDQLRAVVTSARSVTADDTPAAPPSHVWDAVSAELGLGRSGASGASGPSAGGPSSDGAEVTTLPGRLRRRTAVLVAAAALVGILLGSVVTALVTGSDGSGSVVASTRLAALPDRTGSGAAEVRGAGTGRVLQLDVSGLTRGSGFYEVWLLGADGKRLVSVGLLDLSQGNRVTFPLPADVDLSQFPVVDVSLEPADGNPAHSGDSIVRGTLRS
jgi:anti-sigma-K factor RskA